MTDIQRWFQEGKEIYKKGGHCPNWDGTAPTSYIIEGWEQAAKEDGFLKCDCVEFVCPYHK